MPPELPGQRPTQTVGLRLESQLLDSRFSHDPKSLALRFTY
jgi:hypothetical protein